MQTITCAAIREHNPCYDPATKLPEDYSGTVVDFLRQEQIPANDRIWVAKYFVSDRTNRLFAVWCARQALALQANPDPRSTAACDVAERFARGEATEAELSAAAAAAWSAARSAESAAAAAWSAARSAESAESAAASAARSAAASAESAESAAASAARSAAASAQIQYLIQLIEQEEP